MMQITRRMRGMSMLIALVLCCLLATNAESNALYRINVGGQAYTDSNGNEWEPDTLNNYFNVGNKHSTSNDISGTDDPTIYKTERWKASTWTFPITDPGDYQVVLHWAEIYVSNVGARVFDVKIQDELVLNDFDIYAQAGGDFIAIKQEFPVTVTTDNLKIEFIQVAQQPKICGIEILPVASATPDYSLYINAGGPEYVDEAGNKWVADTEFVGGFTYGVSSTEIAGTKDDVIFRSERYGSKFSYEIDVPNGSYQVSLLFAEIYSGTMAVGARVFHVDIQGQPALEDFDIYATVGENTADMETFTAEVTDGTLTIEFRRDKENPKVNGISVVSLGGSSPNPSTTPASTTPVALYRVNTGGGQYTDGEGNVWEADSYFTEGRKFGIPPRGIASTADVTLFLSERYDVRSGDDMRYDFNVPNGSYEVRLGFAEVYGLTTGQRVFNVYVEDQIALSSYDIYVAAGGGDTAVVEVINTQVNDGILTVSFQHIIENPKICNIAIFSTSGGAPPVTTTTSSTTTTTTAAPVSTSSPSLPGDATALVRINVGGPAFSDEEGKEWLADTYFTGGLTYVNSNAPVDTSALGTSDATIYRSERYKDDMSYSLPVANGSYVVVLHWAEIYAGTDEPGQRVFDVLIEGDAVAEFFDITSSVGAYKATAKSFNVVVQDGSLDLSFNSRIENAKLNAIEVLKSSTRKGSGSVVVYRVNAGGAQFTDSEDNVWLADSSFVQNGLPYGPVVKAIAATENDGIYYSERYGPMMFDFEVDNGFYEVKLHFAETYGLTTGQRVFNVYVEGMMALENYDIFASVGADTADVKTVETEVGDGILSVEFDSVVENPKINAIEIYSLGAAPVLPTTSDPVETTPEPVQTTSDPVQTTADPAQTSPPSSFEPIYINVGGDKIFDQANGITWEQDNHFNTGKTVKRSSLAISGTSFPDLYRSERYDEDEYPNLMYNIPVPDSVYEVDLHFCDAFKGTHSVGARRFDVYVEGNLEIEQLDIFATVGPYTALIKTITTTCNDGELDIEFRHVDGGENPTLSGISIKSIGTVKPHYAHAVPGGDYFGTDTTGSGSALVTVDGFYSHTHAAGAELASFEWKLDDVPVATTQVAEISVPVGEHSLSLTVVDTTGDIHEDSTTVTVNPFGYPYIASLSPDSGEMSGGETVTITGSSFTASEADTVVKFGSVFLTGSDINIVDENTIEVLSVPPASWGTVSVTVTTPVAESNPVDYEYNPLIPLNFLKGNILTGIFGPTTLAFGPDGNLYVGTQGGDVIKVVLDETLQEVSTLTSSAIPDSEPDSPFRSILGLAFDPMDTCPPPNGCTVYVSHSFLFHGDIINYNGKVSSVTGAALDIVSDVITGLPVSDHDHGINGLEFDDSGNMFVQVGGNTNAGVPGPLSQTYLQDENYLSAATLIARGVTSPTFDGIITYDADGDMISGFDVDVYSSGMRNPFDLVFHSNGRLYGTDNGPNLKFGNQSLACDENGPDPKHKDKLVLIEEGTYHGHANRKRGEIDPRQCVWRNIGETAEGYTKPIRMVESSTNGICEFQSNHFGKALRGELIMGRYKGDLVHAKLTNEGKGAGVWDELPSVLTNDGGLDVSQAPDGSLVVASNFGGSVFYQFPDEEEAELLTVKSIYPRRGPEAGGTTLTIYGQKLFSVGTDPKVTVGAKDCLLESTNTYIDVAGKTSQWIKCILPSGTGTADVIVSFEGESYTFTPGYRYITGKPNDDLAIGDIILVDALTDKDIGLLEDCDGCIGPTDSVNVRVEPVNAAQVGSISISLTGPYSDQEIENSPPYTLFYEFLDDYSGEELQSGSYSLLAQAFSGSDGSGMAGKSKTVNFSVASSRRLRSRRPDQ